MRFRIPADVDMPDRILAGLTARQLAILAADALLLWGLWALVGRHVPLPVYLALAAPTATAGALIAVSRPDGVPLEKLLAAAVQHLRSPKRRVAAPEGIPALGAWAQALMPKVGSLDLPIAGIDADGDTALGGEGMAAVCRASSVNLALRSETEREALIEGMGRLLNALDAPVQFLIRSEPADLSAVIGELEGSARSLPHPALERAALDHARFLHSFSSNGEALSRRVFLCFREKALPGDEAHPRLNQRVSEADALLRPMGVRLVRLNGEDVAQLLRRISGSEMPAPKGLTLPSEIVSGVR